MAIILKQTDTKNKYQEKIANDLKDKLKNKSLELDTSDHITNSSFLENTKQTSFMSKIWLLLAVVVIISIALLLYRSISM